MTWLFVNIIITRFTLTVLDYRQTKHSQAQNFIIIDNEYPYINLAINKFILRTIFQLKGEILYIETFTFISKSIKYLQQNKRLNLSEFVKKAAIFRD